MPFEARATKPITFTASPLDRVSNLRKNRDWLADRLTDRKSRFLPISDLKALISLDDRPSLGWRSAFEVGGAIADGAEWVVLGTADDICHFAVDVTNTDIRFDGRTKFVDVRAIAPQLAAGEAGILAQARSLIDWHLRHRFCAVCGGPSRKGDGGYVRRCSNDACKAEHFPRTDPVVIMLVLLDDRCLLGRQPRFMSGMFSALAGFIEPGESIEEAVRREVMEEAGISTERVRYVASQPWPFPSSLMIGCFAEATSDKISIDHDELDDARWFERDEIVKMLDRSLTNEAPRMPPPVSLAHQLARAWIEGR